jgi:PKD repeat protein
VSFINNQTTIYTVVETIIHACIGEDQVTVNVETTGDVSFDADNKEGCVPLTTPFTNTSNFSGANCTWYLSNGTVLQGCDNVSYTFNNPGCYAVTLEVETANGCVASITYDDYICIDNDPIAMFNPTPFEVSTMTLL